MRGHLDEQDVEHLGRLAGQADVVGVLGEQQQRLEVFAVVHVRQPLAEPEAGPQAEPVADQRLGVGLVLGPGHPAVGERAVGERLAGHVLVGEEQDEVVLGPVVLAVDDAGRRGLGPPVLEGEQSLLDGGPQRGVELVAVALPEVQQVGDVEVAGVTEVAELLEDRLEVGDLGETYQLHHRVP